MSCKRIFSYVAALFAMLLLGACAGTVATVPESARDTSGQYDGRWIGTLDSGKRVRYVSGTWTRNCTSGQSEFYFDVANGVVSLPLRGTPDSQTPTGFIDANGRFRVEAPRGKREVQSRESGSVGYSTVTWIFTGQLDRESARVKWTIGESHYGGGGCAWNLEMQRPT